MIPMFIFEMANNHFGNIKHGLRIIEQFYKVSKAYPFTFAFKFQYRDLETFIHPDYKSRMDVKYVKRFQETALSDTGFKTLLDCVRENQFKAICTPFDENSVDRVVQHGFDFLKVASCSFTDWPLLEKIVSTELPVIASTAGVQLEDIDRVVAFFKHRKKTLSLMHCVGAYPTPKNQLQLNQISFLKARYPDIEIGFSTHEAPSNTDAIKVAIGQGASIFERHVAVDTPEYGINAYSSTPEHIKAWLDSAFDTYEMCGISEQRHEMNEKEQNDLQGLRRGVFVKTSIKAGEIIDHNKLFYAIPNIEDQLVANDLGKYNQYTANQDLEGNSPVLKSQVNVKFLRNNVLEIVKSLKSIILASNITLPPQIDLELSHHYGIERYYEYGAAILNCINREYCKKLIILLANQDHPVHHHLKKEETFHLLYGDMTVILDNEEKQLQAGDLITVKRGADHSFSSKNGAIFEEISTTHYKDDSFYEDSAVVENRNRKTVLTFRSDWLNKEIV